MQTTTRKLCFWPGERPGEKAEGVCPLQNRPPVKYADTGQAKSASSTAGGTAGVVASEASAVTAICGRRTC